MVNFGFNSNDDEDEERMAFGNVRDMGIWGTALAVSVALHVVVLGALLCTRGCGPGEAGGGAPPPDLPPAAVADAPPPQADEKRPAKTPERTAPKAAPAADVPAGWKTYKVRPGDSLTRIARQYGCTVHELAKANGLSPTANLRLGQTLKVKDAPAD